MTLQEIDKVLRFWNERLATTAETLLDLQGNATLRALRGDGATGQSVITGTTAARVESALKTLRTVFVQFGLLQAAIDRAGALRRELPAMFGGEARAREMQYLLFGRSIQLPAFDPVLQQDVVLDSAGGAARITAQDALQRIDQALASVRDAVSTVERAWADCEDRCAKAEEELSRLHSQRVLPSALLDESLGDVQRLLDDVRGRVKGDSLGAAADLEHQVEPALAALTGRIDAARKQREELREAYGRVEELQSTHNQTVAACQEAGAQVTSGLAGQAPVPDASVEALRVWLRRLDEKCDEGAIGAVAVGLRHWNLAAERSVFQDRKAYERVRGELDQREELRGRVEALQAKARMRGVLTSEAAASLLEKAKLLLHGQTIDLQRAAAAVGDYERYLNGTYRGA